MGEISLEDAPGVRLVDLLSQLPVPVDDQLLGRTFPGPVERGWIELSPIGPARWQFYAILPRRYDAAGKVPGRGLFMNGLWHPQPVTASGAEPVDWQVILSLPEGTTGVLNDAVGSGTLFWTGRAERLSLAVLPHARVRQVPIAAGSLTLIDQGPPMRRRERRLGSLLEEAWPGPGLPHLVVVETPSRRRLARAGPGVLFLSDRALRLTGVFWHYHAAAVRLGLLEAGLDIEDPWARRIAAAALASRANENDPDLHHLLGWFSWIPQIDSLLYDGRLPFYSDAFGELWPGDPVHDDLLEMSGASTPGRAVAAWLDQRFGAGTAGSLADDLLTGLSLRTALEEAGLPVEIEQDWRAVAAAPLHLEVSHGEEGWRAEPSKGAETEWKGIPVQMSIDGETLAWVAGEDPEPWTTQQEERPRKIRLDPGGALPPQDRTDDRWPSRWTAVTAFFPYELTLQQGRFSALAAISIRRQYDSRWRYDFAVETDPEDLVSLDVGVVRYLGPLLDRRSRPFRIWAGVQGSLLDPDFRPTDSGKTTLGAYVGGAWETRVDDDMPRRGHRLSFSTAGGMVPGADAPWATFSLGGVGLAPLGPRLVLAGRGNLGLAAGEVAHRQLQLGGGGNVQGLAANDALGTRKAVGALELRWVALHNMSLPLPLMWLSEVQLSGGLDAGLIDGGDGRAAAVAWSGGLIFVADLFGARPTLLGAGVARPIRTWPDGLAQTEAPQIYIRMTQGF